MLMLDKLNKICEGIDYPFLIHKNTKLKFSEIVSQNPVDLSKINSGDVVAIIGDFNPKSILTLLRLIDKNTIVVPLTVETTHEHEYFFETALVDVVIKDDKVHRRAHGQEHEIIDKLREKKH